MAPEQYQTVNEAHDSVPAPRPLSWELDLFVVNRLLDVAVQLRSHSFGSNRFGPPARPNRTGVYLDELLLDGVTDKRSVVRHLQFLENAGPVGADGAGAQEQFRRNMVDLLARGKQPHHPVLAVGKRLMQGFFGVGGQIGCQFLRKARTDILAPVCHLADGGCQLLAGAFLVDVAGAARLEHLRGMRLFGEHAQNEDGTARVPAFYFLDQLYSASAGHGKVENGHVYVVLRGQDLFQTTPNDRVVVRD